MEDIGDPPSTRESSSLGRGHGATEDAAGAGAARYDLSRSRSRSSRGSVPLRVPWGAAGQARAPPWSRERAGRCVAGRAPGIHGLRLRRRHGGNGDGGGGRWRHHCVRRRGQACAPEAFGI
uniref:Uncharacterized protein n=1 Tax=Arundo donax TaxID=35708 RepID=A0A0A8YLV3_ARUDO